MAQHTTPCDSESDERSAQFLDRRTALAAIAGWGIGTVVFQRALAAEVAKNNRITADMIRHAEWIAGLELTDQQRNETARQVELAIRQFDAMRAVPVDYSVPPAIHFNAAPSARPNGRAPRRDVKTLVLQR